jgi:hypothetical protein
MTLRYVDVEIEFMDGKKMVLPKTTRVKICDGVLNVYARAVEDGPEKHLGAFPLCNVRVWVFDCG